MTDIDALKRRTAYLSVISNTVLVIFKLIVGFSVGAVSLISEALHSGVDLIAAFIAFWAVRKSVAPPDREHDYGHGKFENLSAAVEAVLIVGAAIYIVYEAIINFREAVVPESLGFGVMVMVISIIINLIVSARLISVAKQTGSQALEADGLHLRSDVWTSVGVLVGLFFMQITGWAWLDSVIAIFVAGIIFRAGWHMVVDSMLELTDASLPESEEERIMEIIAAVPETCGCHCLRTRRSGSYRMLDAHVLFPPDMHLIQVHAVCDELEEDIREALGPVDITIHAEPVGSLPETKEERYASLAHGTDAQEATSH